MPGGQGGTAGLGWTEEEMLTHYKPLLQACSPGLVVKVDGTGKGLYAQKGYKCAEQQPRHQEACCHVAANMAFSKGDVVLRELPLCAIQHHDNKARALCCSRCFQFLGSVEEQLAWQLMTLLPQIEGEDTASELESTAAQLASRELRLPGSDCVHLPALEPCPGGCQSEVYCSKECAQLDWDSHHCLLCLGSGSEDAGAAGAARPSNGQGSRTALQAFYHHAHETNDTFRLAAHVFASVLMEAERHRAAGADPKDALHRGWEPYRFIHKAVWWQCVTAPEEQEPTAFARELQQLAHESLDLLRATLPASLVQQYDVFLSTATLGVIMGMFEQNNLGIVAPNPLQQYLDCVDNLPPQERQQLDTLLGPILEHFPEDLVEPCEGTALYAVQACANHSCNPNTQPYKQPGDLSGAAVLVAQRDIAPGEQITISYISEEGVSLQERQAALADYGFVCRCDRCCTEGAEQPGEAHRGKLGLAGDHAGPAAVPGADAAGAEGNTVTRGLGFPNGLSCGEGGAAVDTPCQQQDCAGHCGPSKKAKLAVQQLQQDR